MRIRSNPSHENSRQRARLPGAPSAPRRDRVARRGRDTPRPCRRRRSCDDALMRDGLADHRRDWRNLRFCPQPSQRSDADPHIRVTRFALWLNAIASVSFCVVVALKGEDDWLPVAVILWLVSFACFLLGIAVSVSKSSLDSFPQDQAAKRSEAGRTFSYLPSCIASRTTTPKPKRKLCCQSLRFGSCPASGEILGRSGRMWLRT
jgi:hypothetical protein